MPPMRFELLPYDPSASASASVTSGLARFTVLTPSLLRLEYRSAASPSFEDRATLAVVNRRLPVPRFSWDAARGVLETDMVRLVYTGGSFSSHSLHVQPTAAAAARGFHGWRFGETSDRDLGNLRGTFRTLDQMGNETLACGGGGYGKQHCEWGLVSKSGWALINETAVPRLGAADDWWADARGRMLRGKEMHDLYLFAHGREYKAALRDYASIGGRIPMVPRAALGIWSFPSPH